VKLASAFGPKLWVMGMSAAFRYLRGSQCNSARACSLRCAEARHVAYRDVDKSYASHRLTTWLIARQVQDSAALVVIFSFESSPKKTLLLDRRTTIGGIASLREVFAGEGSGLIQQKGCAS